MLRVPLNTKQTNKQNKHSLTQSTTHISIMYTMFRHYSIK